jgi:hypothetical protein
MDMVTDSNNTHKMNSSSINSSQALPVLIFEEQWTIDDYIRELAAGYYFVKEDFDIPLNEIKLHQIKNLREMLKHEIANAKFRRHKNIFISMLHDIQNQYNKHIEDICDLYSVKFSYPHIEDTEIDKCMEYMSCSLIKYDYNNKVSNPNQNHINLYIIKLGIEISFIEIKLKKLEQKCNLGIE